MMSCLTDDEGLILGEVVLGNLQVEGGRALSNTAGDVVVRTVAGAEPAAKVAGLADGHTTQVGADTQHDQPLGALSTVVVGLGVTQTLPVNLAGLVDLILGAVADEDGLATPLDDDLFGEKSVSGGYTGVEDRRLHVRSCPQGWRRERSQPWPEPGRRRRRTC